MENTIIPKVSVIIPVYKAERYIERCCRSLFEQTLDDLEFIFVDDCSPDDSIQIIERIVSDYPQRQCQLKILSHSPNRGVSYTRQQGMDAAQGEYIIHCDSDDWVDPGMYETLYTIAKEEQADVVCCGFVIELPEGKKRYSTYAQKALCTKVEFNLAPRTGSLCTKIVRLSMLREAYVHFPEGINWGEDFCVSIAGLILSSKTVLLPNVFYHYWQNVESITHTITIRQCEQLVACAPYLESFLHRIGKYEEYEFQLNYLKFQVKNNFLRRKEVRDLAKWVNTYPESHQYIFSYSVSFYVKITAWLVSKHLFLLAKIVLFIYDSFISIR